MMNGNLMIYGDVGVDILTLTGDIPDSGQDARVDSVTLRAGGSAANCAAVASRLGASTTFLGCIGDDHFGRFVKNKYLPFGETFTRLVTVEGDTGVTIAILDPAGEKTFYSYRGVNGSGVLPQALQENVAKSTHLHLSGYSFQDDVSRTNAFSLIEKARDANVSISLDPSYWFSREYHRRFPGLLEDIRILFPNQEEAAILSGSEDPRRAASALLDLGVETIILTRGAEGCYVATREYLQWIPAIDVKHAVDSTGAGDAFCGAFLFGNSIGLDHRESALLGNVVSSLVVGHVGGHEGAPAVDILMERLQELGEKALADKLPRQRQVNS
jgi:ribokinase